MIDPIHSQKVTFSDILLNNSDPVAQHKDHDSIVSLKGPSKDQSCFDLLLSPLTALWHAIAAIFSIILGTAQGFLGIRPTISINWAQAEKEFAPIFTLNKDSTKLFTQKVKELSSEVKERYKAHIIQASGQLDHSFQSTQELSSWITKEYYKFDFDRYFDMNRSDRVIDRAVETYWNEIKSHTQPATPK